MTDNGNTTPSESKKGGKRLIAEWLGNEASPRVEGRTARRITKAEAKKSGEWEIPDNLLWSADNHYRVDVSDTPDSFREMLAKDKSFKITEE